MTWHGMASGAFRARGSEKRGAKTKQRPILRSSFKGKEGLDATLTCSLLVTVCRIQGDGRWGSTEVREVAVEGWRWSTCACRRSLSRKQAANANARAAEPQAQIATCTTGDRILGRRTEHRNLGLFPATARYTTLRAAQRTWQPNRQTPMSADSGLVS